MVVQVIGFSMGYVVLSFDILQIRVVRSHEFKLKKMSHYGI